MENSEQKKKLSRTIASSLLEIKAVKLQPAQPFKWASGWNSPIYCDNRLTLSYPSARKLIRDSFVSVIQTEFPEAESIAGVATAGIPQGVLIADKLELPFIYVRPKPKDHGMGNLIEGKLVPGQKVVVVEDLISTGGSSIKAVEAIRASGLTVLGMVAIFTYGFPVAEENFRQQNVKVISLSNYSDLLEEGISKGILAEKDVNSLQDWRKDPSQWNI